MVAQVAALEHPAAFSALTLAATRPVAPGRLDKDLPDHDAATMKRLFSRSMPDWSDRAAVARFAAGGAEIRGDDPAAARATAERIWDRTPSTQPAVQTANQLGMVFSKLDCKPRWRKRLLELTIPTLVVHGRRDPFFPVGNGEALAREIPGAQLLVREEAATAIPDGAAVKSPQRCSRSRPFKRIEGSACGKWWKSNSEPCWAAVRASIVRMSAYGSDVAPSLEEVIYDLARVALDEQREVVANLRSRAAPVLAGAGALTALLAKPAIDGGLSFVQQPVHAILACVGIVGAIAALVGAILVLATRDFGFSVDAEQLYDAAIC